MKAANRTLIPHLMAALLLFNCLTPCAHAQIANWNTAGREKAEALNSQALNFLTKGPGVMGGPRGARKIDNVDSAMKCLLDATHADPSDPRPYENLGLTMDIKGRYQEALDALTHAYKLAPTAVETTLSIGLTHYLAHNYDKAIGIWQRLIKYDPKLYQVNGCIGMAQMHLGDFDHAAESFQSMLKYFPDSQMAFQGLATLNYLRGDFVNARGAAERAQQIRSYPPVLLLLIEIDFLEGKNDSARKHIAEYVRLLSKANAQRSMTTMGYAPQHEFHWDPFLAEHYDNPSFITARFLDLPKQESKQKSLCRLGKIDQVNEALAQKLQETPQDLWLLHQSGVIEVASGEYLDAADKLGRVVGMCPMFSVDLLYIGRSLKLAGRDKEASAAVREFIGLHPATKLSAIFVDIANVDPTAGPAPMPEGQPAAPEQQPQKQPTQPQDELPLLPAIPVTPGTTPGGKPDGATPPPASTGF